MRAAVMNMPCSQKWVMGVLVLVVGMDWAAGGECLCMYVCMYLSMYVCVCEGGGGVD